MNVIPYWDKRGEMGRMAVLGHGIPRGWLSEGLASDISTLPDAWPWDREALGAEKYTWLGKKYPLFPGSEGPPSKPFWQAKAGPCRCPCPVPHRGTAAALPVPAGLAAPRVGVQRQSLLPTALPVSAARWPPASLLPCAPGPKPARSLPAQHLPPSAQRSVAQPCQNR